MESLGSWQDIRAVYTEEGLCEDPVRKWTSEYQRELLLVDTGPAYTSSWTSSMQSYEKAMIIV